MGETSFCQVAVSAFQYPFDSEAHTAVRCNDTWRSPLLWRPRNVCCVVSRPCDQLHNRRWLHKQKAVETVHLLNSSETHQIHQLFKSEFSALWQFWRKEILKLISKSLSSFCFPDSCWSDWHNYENEISAQKIKNPEPEKQPLCHLCTLNPHVYLLMMFLFKGLLLCWFIFCFLSLLVLHFLFIVVFLNFFLVSSIPCWRCSWSKPQKSFEQNSLHPLWFLFIFSWTKMKNNSCWH